MPNQEMTNYTNPHFDPVSVCGVVSRVQTALPSIRIRLRNLRPGFHPIYPKWNKYVSNVTPFGAHTAGHNWSPIGCSLGVGDANEWTRNNVHNKKANSLNNLSNQIKLTQRNNQICPRMQNQMTVNNKKINKFT